MPKYAILLYFVALWKSCSIWWSFTFQYKILKNIPFANLDRYLSTWTFNMIIREKYFITNALSDIYLVAVKPIAFQSGLYYSHTKSTLPSLNCWLLHAFSRPIFSTFTRLHLIPNRCYFAFFQRVIISVLVQQLRYANMNESWGYARRLSWCRNGVVCIQKPAMASAGDGLIRKTKPKRKLWTSSASADPAFCVQQPGHTCDSRQSIVGLGFPINANERAVCVSHRHWVYIKEKDKYFGPNETEYIGLLLSICLFPPSCFVSWMENPVPRSSLPVCSFRNLKTFWPHLN